MQFLREQAALSAVEITADTLNDFIADSEDDTRVEELSECPKVKKPIWDTILMNVVGMASKRRGGDVLAAKNGSVRPMKINGKHHKDAQGLSLTAAGESLSQGNGVARMIQANIPLYKDVLPGLESWQASKIASWHNLEGHSIQWFCVVCIDRRGKISFLFLPCASRVALALASDALPGKKKKLEKQGLPLLKTENRKTMKYRAFWPRAKGSLFFIIIYPVSQLESQVSSKIFYFLRFCEYSCSSGSNNKNEKHFNIEMCSIAWILLSLYSVNNHFLLLCGYCSLNHECPYENVPFPLYFLCSADVISISACLLM